MIRYAEWSLCCWTEGSLSHLTAKIQYLFSESVKLLRWCGTFGNAIRQQSQRQAKILVTLKLFASVAAAARSLHWLRCHLRVAAKMVKTRYTGSRLIVPMMITLMMLSLLCFHCFWHCVVDVFCSLLLLHASTRRSVSLIGSHRREVVDSVNAVVKHQTSTP